MGPEEFRELVPMFLDMVEDVHVSLDKVMEEGDGAALYSMHVKDSATGKPVSGSGQLLCGLAKIKWSRPTTASIS